MQNITPVILMCKVILAKKRLVQTATSKSTNFDLFLKCRQIIENATNCKTNLVLL